jgi:hypothetical protein
MHPSQQRIHDRQRVPLIAPLGLRIRPASALLGRDSRGRSRADVRVQHRVFLVRSALQRVQGQHRVVHALDARGAVLDDEAGAKRPATQAR